MNIKRFGELPCKDYGVDIVRIYDINQLMLYVSNGVKPIDMYVSLSDRDERPIMIYVFSRKETAPLFPKYRNHQLKMGDVYTKE